MNDPSRRGFVGSWGNIFDLYEATPPVPKLGSGDVRGLLDHVQHMVANAPLTAQQRATWVGIRDRLAGTATGLPPSIAVATGEWFDALAKRDVEAVVRLGNVVLDAVCANGDTPGAARLQDAMQSLGKAIDPWLRGQSTPGPDGATASSGAVDWVEPDDSAFYALNATSGRALSDMLTNLRNAARHIKRGATPPTRCLFDGGPGNGKTEGAKWLARQLDKPLALVRLDGVISKFIGETAARLRAAVEEALARDAVLLIDEIDAIGGHREQAGEGGSGDHTTKVVGAMNQLLDSMPKSFIIIGATNLPGAVDPSVARRLRKRVSFGPPDHATRETMLRHAWRLAPHDGDAFDALVSRTDGRSGDIVMRVADEANVAAGQRAEDAQITVGDVIAALAAMPKEAALGERPSGLLLSR